MWCSHNYKQCSIWEAAYVTKVMGPRRYRIKMLYEDQLLLYTRKVKVAHRVQENTRAQSRGVYRKYRDVHRVKECVRGHPLLSPSSRAYERYAGEGL